MVCRSEKEEGEKIMKRAALYTFLLILSMPALYFWATAIYTFDAWLAQLLPWTVP